MSVEVSRQPPRTATERARLDAVHRYDVLELPPDGTFDSIVAIAAAAFDVPIAIVSIVDEDRIFFAARHGLDVDEIPRSPGLCDSAIMRDEPTVLPDTHLDPAALANPLVAGEMGLRFYAAAPLRTADGHNLGTVCVIDREPRQPDPAQISLLTHLAALVVRELELRRAARTAVALETEAREQAVSELAIATELAETLQAMLLPPQLPAIPGIDIAARYRPSRNNAVGGDFYDVFPLGRRSWGITIGDVCGKGAAAATVAAAARHALRAAAVEHSKPADVLAGANAALLVDAEDRIDGAAFCTAAFARIRPWRNGYMLATASGGHPLPFIVRATGRVEDCGSAGTLLGAIANGEWQDCQVLLRTGDAVVWFTDGVSEAATPDSHMLGRDGVRALLRDAAGASPAELIDTVDAATKNGATGPRDDVAVVALRVNESPEAYPAGPADGGLPDQRRR